MSYQPYPGFATVARTPRVAVPRTALAVLGLLLLVAVVVIGWRPLLHGLTAVGWNLLWLLPLHFLSDSIDSLGWRGLLRHIPERPNAWRFAWIAAIRDAGGALLPIIGSASPFVGVAMLMRQRVRAIDGAASVFVESTLSLISQALFALGIAVAFGLWLHERRPLDLVWLPALLTAGLGGLLLLLQRHRSLYERTLQLLQRIPLARRLGGTPLTLYESMRRIHDRSGDLLRCVGWQIGGLVVGALELWLILHLLHFDVNPLIPLLLQVTAKLSRSIAFAVPANLGVQEGVFAVIAAVSGLPVSVGLSLSLLSRCRDLLFGVPVLVIWLLQTQRNGDHNASYHAHTFITPDRS